MDNLLGIDLRFKEIILDGLSGHWNWLCYLLSFVYNGGNFKFGQPTRVLLL